MILLDTTARTLQVALAGAVTTNQLPIVASYVDIAQATFTMTAAALNTTQTNGATAVTAVSAPAAATTRQLKYLSVFNADTVAATVIVQLNDNSTERVIVETTLQVGETLSFDAESGWQTLTAAGGIKSSSGSSGGATYTSSPLSPTAPSSTSAFLMQGMAGAITPRTTGNIRVNVSGTFVASAALVDQGIIAQISYGTGAAPGSNVALAGTQVGAQIQWTNLVAATAAGDIHVNFSVSALITGAVIGTALWLDIAAKAVTTASVFSLAGAVITATEV